MQQVLLILNLNHMSMLCHYELIKSGTHIVCATVCVRVCICMLVIEETP